MQLSSSHFSTGFSLRTLSMNKAERIENARLNAENKKTRKRVKRQSFRKWRHKDTNRMVSREKTFIAKKIPELQRRATGAEIELKRKLDQLGIKYEFQWAFYYRGYAGIADFYLPEYNLIIEVDGGYHCKEEQRIKDRIRDQVCADNLGKPILRLVNEYAISVELSELKRLIEQKKNKVG